MPGSNLPTSANDRYEITVNYAPRLLVCRWKLKVKNPATGRYEPVKERRNLFTDAGLTNLAKMWMNQGIPSVNLVIDSFKPVINNATLPAGSTSVTLLSASSQPHKAGDVQLILGVGLVGQETVTYSGASSLGGGLYQYILSAATVNAHAQNEWAVRKPLQSDVLADIKSEVQYDAVAAPGQRMTASGPGYSQGTANYVMQFFLTGSQALTNWVTLGLSDNLNIGSGALMNHLAFGFTHATGDDVELDVSLTLANA